MSLEAGIFNVITANSALASLQADRVFRVLLPDGTTLPATVFTIVGGGQESGLTSAGPQSRRVQFDCHADALGGTADQASAIARALIDLLDGFTGQLPGGPAIQSCLLLNEFDRFDNDARNFVRIVEFRVKFTLS